MKYRLKEVVYPFNAAYSHVFIQYKKHWWNINWEIFEWFPYSQISYAEKMLNQLLKDDNVFNSYTEITAWTDKWKNENLNKKRL